MKLKVDLLSKKETAIGKATFILTLLAAFLILTCCNNNTKSNDTAAPATVKTDSSANNATADTSGSSTMPAQVFEQTGGKTIGGATVTATLSGKLMETATTDANGIYGFKTLLNGQTYTYAASMAGFTTMSKTAVYEGSNSLPDFPLVIGK